MKALCARVPRKGSTAICRACNCGESRGQGKTSDDAEYGCDRAPRCLRNQHRFADRELIEPEYLYRYQHFPIPLLSRQLHLLLYTLCPSFRPLYDYCAYISYALLAGLLVLFRHQFLMSQYSISPSPRDCSHFSLGYSLCACWEAVV